MAASLNERDYPKTWSLFERKLKDGRRAKFQVQDIPEDMRDTVVEFMMGNYIREEVWCATAGTAKDPVAVQEYRVLLASIVRDNMSAACFLVAEDGAGRTLVGASIGLLQKRNEIVSHSPPKSTAGLTTLRMFMEAMKITAIYDKYEANEYLMGAGLSVTPEFRGLGIGVELLLARKAVARELGIRIVGSVFTGAASQRSAELAGYETCFQLPYEQFGRQCGVTFGGETDTMKICAVEVL